MNNYNKKKKENKELTHFELVGEFHSTFDHPKKEEIYYDCFDNDPKLLHFRLSLIKEELKEFTNAYIKEDLIEMADALCDLAYVTYGTGQALGINIDCLLSEMNIDICLSIDRHVDMNSCKEYEKDIKQMIKTIKNLINRFNVSIETRDIGEIADHLVIILKNVYELGHKLNFKMNQMFREVHRSNMTKVCTNIDDANESINFYLSDSEKRYDSPSIKIKGSYFVIYDIKTTKILKNHKWETPKLEQFF